MLILFEDAHWADATSLEVLDLLIQRVPRLPALLLITFRPEFEAPWSALPDVASIALGRLDRIERRPWPRMSPAAESSPRSDRADRR